MRENTIRLGLMPPLTGLVEMYGAEITRAGQIACDEVNESGGVLGKPLELVIEDDGSLPESAVAAAARLVDHHRCAAIIGNLLSNSRIAVAYQVAEPRRIPYLNFSFYEGSILSHYFFHFAALPNQQIERMIPYMRNQYGPRMFFAGNNYEWPRGSIDAAKRALERAGGLTVGEEYYPIGVGDGGIERLLDQVAESGAEVFVPYFAGADQTHLLTRFTARGLKSRMAVVMGHYDEVMASRLPPEVREGFYSSNTYFMTLDTPENKAYLARLAAQPGVDGIWPQGGGILTNFGEGAYLCVKAFAKAANQAGSLNAEALVKALETIGVSGPQGIVQMDPATHHAQVNTCLSRCQSDGSFAIIERFGAIPPVLPERYRHLRISKQTGMEDIYLESRMMAQITEAVLLVHATDGAIVYANPGAERMFGYKPDELSGKRFSVLFAPGGKSPEEATAAIGKMLSRKGAWQGETENVTRDGKHFWCAASVSVFTHPEFGEVWMILNKDITERKQAEEQLRTSEALLRRTQSMAAIGSWRLNVPQNELVWSAETYRIFGIPASTPLTYDSFLANVHPDDRERVNSAWQAALKGAPYLTQHRIVAHGETRWVEEHAELDFDYEGNLRSGTGSVQDITERKRAEMTLARNVRDLNERVKEIECLRDITRLSLDKELSVEQMLDACTRRMPAAWLDPAHTCARIRLDKLTFETGNFRETSWRLAADIPMTGREAGLVEVFYFGEPPGGEASPFLDEERTLIQSIATQISQSLEKRQAEEVLRQSEARFRRLVKVAPIPLCYVAKGAVIQDFNDRFAQVFGYTHEDIPTLEEWWQLAYPDEDYRRWVLATWNAAVQVAAESGQDIQPVEYNVTCKNGDVRIMEISGVTLGEDFLATFTDLTSRKQSEEKLRIASLYARSLIEASLDPLVTISAEGKITDVNKATEEATGFSRSELTGADFADYFTEPEKARTGYRQVFDQGFVRDYPLTIRHRAGHQIDVLYNATIYRDEAGNILGVLAAARDITERKRAEESTRISQARFSTIFNQAPLGIALIDSFTGRIYEVNPRFAEIAGRTIEEMMAIDWMSITHPDDVQADLDNMAQLNAGKISGFNMDKRYVRPDGSFVWINMTIAPLRVEQNISPRHLCMIDDITERKQAEEKTRQLNSELEQRVAERTAELESFAYSVSHDLRVPLRAIDGFSRLVLKQYGDRLDDEGKRLLNVVRDNTKKMGQLIDDILAFSRTGRLEIKTSVADMAALARDAWQELEPSIAGRDLRLDIKPLSKMRGDPAMLRQVWANLLANAVKFTRTKPEARIEIEEKIEESECIYSIKDNGVGFDQQYVDKLFGVFQRLHGMDEFEGTGIGLAIVKRIITRHGGRVWAEGKINEGATFYFALPILKEKRS